LAQRGGLKTRSPAAALCQPAQTGGYNDRLGNRPMNKTTLIAILFSLLVLGVLIYSSMNLQQFSCEVCITYQGRNNCSTAAGTTREEAARTATDVACAPITNGMTESIQCSNTPPTSVNCTER
jgi:hypothetical protein